MKKKSDKAAQYVPIILYIFRKYWTLGTDQFEFHRDDLVKAAVAIGVERPDNLGDVIYSFRYRRELPTEILQTAPEGKAWIIEGAGPSRYRFRLVERGGTTIKPRADVAATRFRYQTSVRGTLVISVGSRASNVVLLGSNRREHPVIVCRRPPNSQSPSADLPMSFQL
jgi:hypothetical protein